MTDTFQLEKARDWSGSLTLGIFVIALYIFFVGAVFAGFATYIYRSEWKVVLNEATANPVGTGDLDSLIFTLKQEESLLAGSQVQRDRLVALNLQKLDLDREILAIAAERDALDAQAENEGFLAIATFKGFFDVLGDGDMTRLNKVLDDGKVNVSQRAETALAQLDNVSYRTTVSPTRRDNVQVQIDTTRAFFAQIAEQRKKLDDRDVALKPQLAQIGIGASQADAVIAANEERLAALRERLPLGSPDRARLDSLSSMLFGNLFQRLVSFPTIFLTLIVTMAAGGLGTVVAFSRRFYSDPKGLPSVSRLFVNVGEGIAAAIAIFLFSGAGMLALTQGAGSGGEVELSPFAVAFVAFLSGFMAEDAFSSIQAAGKRIFNQDQEDSSGG